MAVVRLAGHDERTGALELLRLFYGSSAVNSSGDLQGGDASPLLVSSFTLLSEGSCQVETRVAEPGPDRCQSEAGSAERNEPAAPDAMARAAMPRSRCLGCGQTGARPAPLARREIKRQLYEMLAELTGMSFPYGSLTGIRPTRLAAEQLAAGLEPSAVSAYLEHEYGVAPTRAGLLAETAANERRLLAELPPEQPLLYLHVPFCPSRCSYCSFPCETAGRRIDLDAYVAAMVDEAQSLSPHFRQPVSAIYLGGGTPTVLNAAQLDRLLAGVLAAVPRTGDTEFTVEAGRADTIDPERLAVIRAAGAGRICINPQTLQDRTLLRIGRQHSRAGWLQAFRQARAAGFPIINADLIAGLPGEMPADFAASLTDLLQESPENITIHTLAYKRKSALTRSAREGEAEQDASLSGDAAGWSRALDQAHEALAAAGFEPYYLYRQKDMIGGLENTGYARPGTGCRYNVGMMSDERTVIGIGAGAMSKYIDAGGWLRRLPAPREPSVWMQGRADAASERIQLLL